MPTAWDEYLQPPEAARDFARCHLDCRGAFEAQRRIIQRIFVATAPKTIVCMGAGLLNDIPFRSFVRSGATLHLVDWVPGIIDNGIARSAIDTRPGGLPDCVFCGLDGGRAREYCKGFKNSGKDGAHICDSFEPLAGNKELCAAYERGNEPSTYHDDATGDATGAFARAIPSALDAAKSWREAFSRALTLARKIKRHHLSLGIPDDAADLVISSMLISQFSFEPYEFFSKCATDRLGPPHDKEERRLHGRMEELRSILLTNAVEHHAREVARMLGPEGRWFVSFELFHRRPDGQGWFLVEDMHKALAMLARRFDFDFDPFSDNDFSFTYGRDERKSVVVCFLARAKAE